MSNGALLKLREIQRVNGSFRLEVQSLSIPAGQTTALLGPTGAGKSTLLRLLGGLDEPTSGELDFDKEPLLAECMALDRRRRMTLVDQRPLLVRGSVRYNVASGLRFRGHSRGTPEIDAVLERLQLKLIEQQSARTLSGGQTQLVAMARALVIQPELLLLDEPTSHLDPAHVALVEAAVKRLQEECGTTVVWATHNLFQARRVARYTAFLWNGTLVEFRETEQFFQQPHDSRTADFVAGRMVY